MEQVGAGLDLETSSGAEDVDDALDLDDDVEEREAEEQEDARPSIPPPADAAHGSEDGRHARDRNAARALEEARGTLYRLLAEIPARRGWLMLNADLQEGALSLDDLWSTPPGDDAVGADPRETLDEIVVLLQRAACPVDPTFDEPLPEAFVARRLLALVTRFGPDKKTCELILERAHGVDDLAFCNRLSRATQALSAAEARLIQLHERLVDWVLERMGHRPLEQQDLRQEAMTGLLRAVRRFRSERGTRFATYAQFWIRAMAERSVADGSRIVRVPVHMHDTLRRVARVAKEFERIHRRAPDAEELARACRIEVGKAREMMLLMLSSAVSLEGEGEDGAPALANVLSASGPSAEQRALAKVDRRRLDAALTTLDGRTREVIIRRFGLDGEPEETLEMVGQRHGVTRERIRQLEKKGLERLRIILAAFEK